MAENNELKEIIKAGIREELERMRAEEIAKKDPAKMTDEEYYKDYFKNKNK
ncbi:hypothetical protein Q604_UNBc4C00004G0002 [human gut metagenome]|uniref:Uncharacterized protein n=1 Tax=human gut metagenome TaxID=408170 RepID=W1WGH9_9ZZZZ